MSKTKTKTMKMAKTKTMTMTMTMREHPQRNIRDLWPLRHCSAIVAKSVFASGSLFFEAEFS